MELWGLLLYLRPFCTIHLALAVCKPYPQKEQQWCASGIKLAPQEGHSRSVKKQNWLRKRGIPALSKNCRLLSFFRDTVPFGA